MKSREGDRLPTKAQSDPVGGGGGGVIPFFIDLVRERELPPPKKRGGGKGKSRIWRGGRDCAE